MAYKYAYFIRYQDILKNDYVIRIYRDTDDEILIKQVDATCVVTFDEAKDLTPIRKSRAEITLLADKDTTYFDLLPNTEQDVLIEIERNEELFFKGFLLADGFFQDYVNDKWQCTLIASDGLDLLSNYAYVDSNGDNFTGRQTIIQVLDNCLKRTGHNFDILYLSNLKHTEFLYPVNDETFNFFDQTKIDNLAFYDDGDPKTCYNVIENILTVSNCFLIQYNGKWVITSITALLLSNTSLLYFKYSGGTESVSTSIKIGDVLNNFYPHHCNENQKIEAVPSLGASKGVFTYGDSIDSIDDLTLSGDGSTYNNYNIEVSLPNSFILIEDGAVTTIQDTKAIRGSVIPPDAMLESTPIISVLQEDYLDVTFEFFALYGASIGFSSAYQVILTNTTSTQDWYLNNNGSWKTSGFVYSDLVSESNQSYFLNIKTNPLPEDGDIVVRILKPYVVPATLVVVDSAIKTIGVVIAQQSATGEKSIEVTVEKLENPSSVIRDKVDFIIGDNSDIQYKGSLLDMSDNTIVNGWVNEFYDLSPLPLIAISLGEMHVLRGTTSILFSGDVYGYVPYLSKVQIDGLNGSFLVVGHSFDTYNNITNLVLIDLNTSNTPIKTTYYTQYNESNNPTIK